jgi:hypothetical protein
MLLSVYAAVSDTSFWAWSWGPLDPVQAESRQSPAPSANGPFHSPLPAVAAPPEGGVVCTKAQLILLRRSRARSVSAVSGSSSLTAFQSRVTLRNRESRIGVEFCILSPHSFLLIFGCGFPRCATVRQELEVSLHFAEGTTVIGSSLEA